MSLETTSPAVSKHAATSGRETKSKVPNKVLTKEEKGIESAKRRGRRGNRKERKDSATVAQQVRVSTNWYEKCRRKQERIVGVAPGMVEAIRDVWKKEASTAIYLNLTKEAIGVQRMHDEAKIRAEDTRIMLADLATMDDDTMLGS
jgi:hypothetical protein